MDEAKNVVRILTSYVNTSLADRKISDFVGEMSREHRSLQQNFTGLCVAWLEHLSRLEPEMYDDRNEASVKLGREFVERISREKRHLPTI